MVRAIKTWLEIWEEARVKYSQARAQYGFWI